MGPDTICRASAGRIQPENSPSLPVTPTPAACPPDLSQFLQRLAVYLSAVQAMDPAVGEGAGPGRARSPDSVQTLCPTGAAPWSLGIRAQECLGRDRQELRRHCRAGKRQGYNQEACYQHLGWPKCPQTLLDTGWKQVGFLGPPGRRQTPPTSPAFPTTSCPLGFRGVSPLLPGRRPF